MKKILTVLLLTINITVFSTMGHGSGGGNSCESDLDAARALLLSKLNYRKRGRFDEAYNAYNTMVNNYNLSTLGSRNVSCQFNLLHHERLIQKIDNVQHTLNSQINNNFNGKKQIPYNQNYTYNGFEFEYEIKRGDIEDSTGNTYTTEKRQSNTALEGTDHVGLIKYMYGIAGISTGAFNELELEDFAAMTKYQLKQGMPLRPGDLIIMNYKNNGSIDTVGLVYQDVNGQLKMLEMGGNMYEEGSSVKSSIPMTDANNTAYVVPFETIMNKAYSVEDDTDIRELRDVKESVHSRGKILNLPSNNPKITVYSPPRNQTYLAYNGFTSADPIAEATENINQENIIKEITEMTGNFFSTANKGMAGFSALIMAIMVFLITINVLWTVFKGGLHGSVEEIVKSILGQIAQKAPYFVFVALYPVLMKNVIMPLFLHKLPTHLFGEFIKVSKISMENGKYVTYSDLIIHIVKKGMPLILGTFGAGVMKQKESIGGLFKFFSTIWKVIGGWFSGDTSVLDNAWQTFGLLFSISRVIMQTVIFRPITSLAGLMTIITLLNIALNVFLSSLTFIISTSVGLFYMIFGMTDITKSKALNTLQIIVSGFLQYLVNFGAIIVLAMVIEIIGMASLGVILTPFNFVNTIKVFLCISIIQSVVKQVGVSIAINF
ncbi:MAG: hypothetical protein Q4D53_06505 [Leptotrichiaceae bacterium]|nr:hypothetical protein [Leptotrichiaceae bacterium]